MAATLVETLAAVRGVLAPLVTAGTITAVLDGLNDSLGTPPVIDVLWGPATEGRDPGAGVLLRQQQRTGVARIYVARRGVMRLDYARVAPIIDAVEAAFRDAPTLGGLVDRFDATGHGQLLPDEQLSALYVDVNWTALTIEEDTFIQDW